MRKKELQGELEVIESFAMTSRNEFYLIGRLKAGEARENWFANITLNSSLVLTLRIKAVEEIEMASDRSKYILLIIGGEPEELDIFLSMRIGSETVGISIDGQD